MIPGKYDSEKAEHVRANWQDEPLAMAWEETANELSTMNLQENL